MESFDHDCFAAARAGDPGAVERLIERYQPRLHAYIRLRLGDRVRAREASMDVVQSVCRELLAAAPAFEFRGEERFRDWLFTAALNKIRDKQRFHGRDKRDAARELDVDDNGMQQAASFLTPSVDAIGHETAAAVRKPRMVLKKSGSSKRNASWPLSLSISTNDTLAAIGVECMHDGATLARRDTASR